MQSIPTSTPEDQTISFDEALIAGRVTYQAIFRPDPQGMTYHCGTATVCPSAHGYIFRQQGYDLSMVLPYTELYRRLFLGFRVA